MKKRKGKTELTARQLDVLSTIGICGHARYMYGNGRFKSYWFISGSTRTATREVRRLIELGLLSARGNELFDMTARLTEPGRRLLKSSKAQQ